MEYIKTNKHWIFFPNPEERWKVIVYDLETGWHAWEYCDWDSQKIMQHLYDVSFDDAETHFQVCKVIADFQTKNGKNPSLGIF